MQYRNQSHECENCTSGASAVSRTSAIDGVVKEIWGNEAESCLAVAYVFDCFRHEIKENCHFEGSEAGQLLSSCLIFGQNLRLNP